MRGRKWAQNFACIIYMYPFGVYIIFSGCARSRYDKEANTVLLNDYILRELSLAFFLMFILPLLCRVLKCC